MTRQNNARRDLGRIVWEASHHDEGSISVTGAGIIADSILAAGYAKPDEREKKHQYAVGALRLTSWAVVPMAALVIQLRQASRQPGWAGYLRFMAAWQLLGIGHRLYELWLAGKEKS